MVAWSSAWAKVPRVIRAFANRSRAGKRLSQQIERMTSRERRTRQTRKYRELPEITQKVGQSARGVLHTAKTPPSRIAGGSRVPALRPCNVARFGWVTYFAAE